MAHTYEYSAEASISVSWQHTKIDGNSGRRAYDNNSLSIVQSLTNGTGAGQFDQLFHDQRTVAAASDDDMDLVSGTLVDMYGETFSIARVKAMVIQNLSTHADAALAVGGATNAWASWLDNAGDIVLVEPEGIFILYTKSAVGYPVTSGTADILRCSAIDASQGVTYDIALLGCSS